MIFAKIDVSLRHHHRLMNIGPECVAVPLGIQSESDGKRADLCTRLAHAAALGLWTAALLYTRDHMLDGFCPLRALGDFAVDEVIDELVARGLLVRDVQDGCPGVVIVNYAKHNETKAQIDRRMGKDRARKRPGRAAGRRPDTGAPPRSEPDRVPSGFPMASDGIPRPESESETETELRKELPSQAPAPGGKRAERAGEHGELIAYYAAEFERLKGVRPVIGAKGGAGAKRLLQGRSLAEAKAIVDRALSDPWMLENSPDLAAIAGKINSFIGRRAVVPSGARVLVQPATGSWRVAEPGK